MVRGYARLRRMWKPGDVVELAMDMPVRRVKAHAKVKADVGRVALMRGPIVYCLEGVDNGGKVQNLFIPPEAQFTAEHRPDLLGGVTIVRGSALGLYRAQDGGVEQKDGRTCRGALLRQRQSWASRNDCLAGRESRPRGSYRRARRSGHRPRFAPISPGHVSKT